MNKYIISEFSSRVIESVNEERAPQDCVRWKFLVSGAKNYIPGASFYINSPSSFTARMKPLLDIGLCMFVPIMTTLWYPHPCTACDSKNVIHPSCWWSAHIPFACPWSPLSDDQNPLLYQLHRFYSKLLYVSFMYGHSFGLRSILCNNSLLVGPIRVICLWSSIHTTLFSESYAK